MAHRQTKQQFHARATSDGDGVKIKRVFGGHQPAVFDPFLMMDEFGSASADDYIGGFPPHPHRGFETITYMLQGRMEHRDHLGNRGLLCDGGVQWMTAGKGVIHSEMPQQTDGLMRGFQIWLNLPAADKMQPAGYEDVAPESIPTLENTGIFVKAIAGETSINGESLKGYFTRPYTLPIILDVRLAPGKTACIALPDTHVAMAYVYDGSATVGSPDDSAGLAKTVTEHGTLSVTSGTGDLVLTNTDNAITTKCIVLAGKPLQESVVQHGPFVMNTAAEIEQAILDYRSGQLTG